MADQNLVEMGNSVGNALKLLLNKGKPQETKTPDSGAANPAAQVSAPAIYSPQPVDGSGSGLSMGQPVEAPPSPSATPRPPRGEFGGLGEFAYDPSAVQHVLHFYTSRGYDPRFAAAMAANGLVESTLNPTAFNKKEDAFGVFQFRNDRITGLRAYADRVGKSANDIDAQLGWSLEEMRTTEKAAWDRITGGDPNKSAADIARLVDRWYERSDGKAREHRAGLAAQIYGDFFADGNKSVSRELSYGDAVPDDWSYKSRDEHRFDMMKEMIDQVRAGNAPEGMMGTDAPLRIDPTQLSMGTPVGANNSGNPMGIDPTQLSMGTKDARAGASPTVAARQPAQTQSPQGGVSTASGNGVIKTGKYIPPEQQTAQEWSAKPLGAQVKEMFMGYEGETASGLRDRRRAGFLAAAEGFHALSTGEKANYLGVAQQQLNERQRAIANIQNDAQRYLEQQKFQVQQEQFNRQETRLLRSQALIERKQKFEEAKYDLEQKTASEQRAELAAIAEDAGAGVAAKIITAGDTKTGMAVLKDQLKSNLDKDEPFTLSDDTVTAMQEHAVRAGLPALAKVLTDPKASKDTKEKAFKEIAEAEAKDGAPFSDEQVEERFEELNNQIEGLGNRINPGERESLKSFARHIAKYDEKGTLVDDFSDRIVRMTERKTPGSAETEQMVTEHFKRRSEASAGEGAIYSAANRMMDVASNPGFTPGAMEKMVMVPAKRFSEWFVGKDVASAWTGINDVTQNTMRILDGSVDPLLGNLADGISGALSNLEGDRVLSQFSTGGDSRVAILTLAQISRRKQEAQTAADAAQLKYLHSKRESYGSVDLEQFRRVGRMAKENFETFVNFETDLDRLNYLQDVAEEHGLFEVDKNGAIVMHNEKFAKLPPHIRGEVVTVSNPETGEFDFVPLFKEFFPEYKDK